MKKALLISIIGIFLISIISLFCQEFTYVGAGKCKICHKTEKQGKQFPLWEERKHSKSFAPLTTEEIKAKVQDAPENPECLKCHAPLFEKAPELTITNVDIPEDILVNQSTTIKATIKNFGGATNKPIYGELNSSIEGEIYNDSRINSLARDKTHNLPSNGYLKTLAPKLFQLI